MLLALNREWLIHPPLAYLLAAFVGYKPPDKDKAAVTAPADTPRDSAPAAPKRRGDDLAELAAMFPAGPIRLSNPPDPLNIPPSAPHD